MKYLLVRLKTSVTIDKDLEKPCDSNLTKGEIKTAVFSMKKCKSPGGLSVEFYIHL